MQTAETIKRKLTESLAPATLEIVDESYLHAGHVGARPEGETHFRVRIVAAAFDGTSRLDRHRLIHRLLASELAGGVHALALTTLTPAEAAARR